MSDRPGGRVLLLGALLFPAVLAAQDVTALRARLALAQRLRHEARVALTRADSIRQEPVDTVVAGALKLFVRPDDSFLIRRSAGEAWGTLDSIYGDAAHALITKPMLFYVETRPVRYFRLADVDRQPVMVAENATPADAEYQLVRAGASVIRAKTDTALASWLGPLLLPSVHADAERSRVYVELVTAPSAAVRQCYAGDIAACRAALRLRGGDLIALWFDPAERRALVRRATEYERRQVRESSDGCLLAQSDSDCLKVLHTLWIDAPLSADARQSLVRLALDRGGRQAYIRLLDSRGRPMAERLEDAARVPIDSLVAQWRDRVLAARPKVVTLTVLGGWTALVWAVAFGVAALGSSRWR